MTNYFTEYTTDEAVDAAALNSRLTELDEQLFALASGTGYENQPANRVLAGPTSGSAAAPSFRTLVGDDLATALESPPAIGGGTPAAGTFTALVSAGLTVVDEDVEVIIDGDTGSASMRLDTAAGGVAQIRLMDDEDDVWRIQKDASEDLVITRYVADVLQDEALKIINSTGAVVVANELQVVGDVNLDGTNLGFYGATPGAKPTITGSRGGNAALGNLLTALATLGLITNSTS